MSWTITKDGSWIELVPDGSTDFVWETQYPLEAAGVRVEEVQFVFNTAADKLVMRTHRNAGVKVFEYTTSDGSSVSKRFYGATMIPRILNSEITGTATNMKIIIQTRP
jgi:hypothetical protein